MGQKIKSFGDWVVDDYVPSYTDSEYERLVEFQSNTVAMAALPVLTAVLGALLALLLPGYYSLLSLTVYVPMCVVGLLANSWMKHYAPRPENIVPARLMNPMGIAMAVQAVAILLSLGNLGDRWFFLLLVMAAAGVGVYVGMKVDNKSKRERRQRDRDRLNEKEL